MKKIWTDRFILYRHDTESVESAPETTRDNGLGRKTVVIYAFTTGGGSGTTDSRLMLRYAHDTTYSQ